MENLNGRELVEAGDLCERRNGSVAYCNDSVINMMSWTNKMLIFCTLCQGEVLISIEIGA